MPNVAIYNISGAKVGEMELSENIFGQELNVPAMHAYVKAYLANQRQGTQSVKTRRGSFRRRQKALEAEGTGRARSGFNPDPPSGRTAALYSAPKPPRLSHEPQQRSSRGLHLSPLFRKGCKREAHRSRFHRASRAEDPRNGKGSCEPQG